MMETETIADEGPCACDPQSHKVLESRKNATGSITRRRYKCLFCLRRWSMYDLTVSEMERLRHIESGVTALLKAIHSSCSLRSRGNGPEGSERTREAGEQENPHLKAIGK